ncbi:MAG TPA: hypothetical protein VLE96_01825 [Chlamydiales bacterium]|nr:hypothetical protein [Chlamydiales bacterium]
MTGLLSGEASRGGSSSSRKPATGWRPSLLVLKKLRFFSPAKKKESREAFLLFCRQSDVIRTFDWKKLKEKLTIFSLTPPDKFFGVQAYG